ncbi:DNA polymerase theta [Golovinomyces cichoracearum]|uniref:DNA polymerase theta n=1 Tax=Golovinomyces cichoracearum TaxID=62708 RepID=A0A420HJE5_9PEZI|nr:DNA polymerase theta [Golovinomyces cichoracearum]
MYHQKKSISHASTLEKVGLNKTTIEILGQKRSFDDFQKERDKCIPALKTGVKHHKDFQRPVLHTSIQRSLKAGEIINVSSSLNTDYSQRKKLALTPAPSSDPKLDLAHPLYGLPNQLIKNLSSLGISSIYPWQSECLLKSGALDGKTNLIYSAPTGGGKSLVADVIMLKKILENPGKKALLVLPYVALVQEKTRWLRKLVEGIPRIITAGLSQQRPSIWQKKGDEETIKVVGFFGGSKSKDVWSDYDIAVCTIEKGNALVNSAVEERSSKMPAIVVMDELHMIDDEHRGYLLELMASKILSLNVDVQLIGMSATLNNPQLLAKWLRARFYISQYKPVPIEEHLVFDNAIYPASTSSLFYKTAIELNNSARSQKPPSQTSPSPCRIIKPSESKELKNPLVNSVVSLANETARAGYGVLVFCSSRMGCERNAKLISLVMPPVAEVDHMVMEDRINLLTNLRSTSVGLDHILEKTIPSGVAFHHAGLTSEERELVTTAYDKGTLKVLVATCSLAAGINLPARRVILHGARMGADLIGPSLLRQMKGRAGRKGKDEIGETFLCCQKCDIEAVAELMEADLPRVESCLVPGKRGIKRYVSIKSHKNEAKEVLIANKSQRALLEIIAVKLATSKETLNEFINNTLVYQSMDSSDLSVMVQSSLKELSDSGLVKCINDYEYKPTRLGKAIVASCLTPEDGLFVHSELRKALQAFVMDGEMHALYIFTPVQTSPVNINWKVFREEVESLSESNLRLLEFLSLKLVFINKMAQGGVMKESTPQEIESARIYRRFYTALQLRDLCNEVPIYSVARKYEIPRGNVQNLAQTCQGFAAGMIKFCERMEWGALGAILDHYRDRLKAGAKCDLLALAEVKYIKSKTARIFWDNGFKTVGALAAADIPEILTILLMAQPRKPRTSAADEERFKKKLRCKAEIISVSANKIWEKQMQAELELEDEDSSQ